MPAQNASWGKPPWRVDFVPAKRPLPAEADFAVVGSGFTGLSAASWLRRLAPEKSVVVFESGRIGEGASGRTGGLALAETAAGDLPGLGDVLAGYQKILRDLRISSCLSLTGAWELGRSHTLESSPIVWKDSGTLRVVREVPGGTVDPGKIVAGLAHAAEKSGAQLVEHAEVQALDFSNELRLRMQIKTGGRLAHKELRARRVLLATDAASLELAGLHSLAEAKLTFALATAPLSDAQIEALGLASRLPFYTVDYPYLWGRSLASNGVIFGSGLVSASDWRGLRRLNVSKGQSAERLRWLEQRVRELHPVLKKVRVTHRWGGPIFFTPNYRPIFRQHPKDERVIIVGGFCGHGVALSVYLGHWAAQALLSLRPLPRW